jgi:hypothetical protein
VALNLSGATDTVPAGEGEIKATVRGGLLDVHCEICGAVRTWVPGEEGLRELLGRVSRIG